MDKLDEQRKRAKSSRTEEVDEAFNEEFAKQVDLAIAVMEEGIEMSFKAYSEVIH